MFVANTTGLAEAADDRFIYETDTGNLYFDSDGNGVGASSLIAVFTGFPTLNEFCFLFF